MSTENSLTPVAVSDSALAPRADWSGHWKALAASTRADPGVWYTLADAPAKFASAIRAGRMKAFSPASEFEVKVHNKQLYIRWVGGE